MYMYRIAESLAAHRVWRAKLLRSPSQGTNSCPYIAAFRQAHNKEITSLSDALDACYRPFTVYIQDP